MFPDDVNTMFALAVIITCILIILGFPFAFKLSPRIQRFALFVNFDYPILPKFDNPEYYGLRGVHNVYISRWKNLKNEEESSGASFISYERYTKSQEKREVVSLGTWFINHENHINSNAGVDQILEESTCPILLYLHGMACNRILPYENKYDILRKSFHVVAIDYRGFGDSSNDIISENSLVEDAIQAYEWVKSKTDCDIYVWGHSLGSAIASRTVEQLSKTGHPIGLVLESSFPSLAEGVPYHPIAKFFSLLFYFKYTVLDTLRDNGFTFNNSSFIENVDCPILIFHAEDDSIVPSFLGKQLYINTKKSRKLGQGPVAFHMIPTLGYGHKDLITYSGMPVYISEFMRICKEFKLCEDEVTDDYIKVYAAS